ncbi:MAG: JDVT-CTERM system glutamic-type intramembrane protease MrtJ [Gammaproteobacteria bacterium]|nr:JDVT-CTERM system glutamic-type intramembrane protease [Gammaproteobacteria bacterium]
MWRDRQRVAAFAAGPLFWLLLLAWGARVDDLSWPLRSPVAFALPVFVFPALEEFVFRGGLQEWLRSRLGGAGLGGLSAANLLTSVVFAALHGFAHPPLWAALIFFPSLVFGYFMDRDRRLAVPIALHVFYNLGYYWLFVGR